MVSGQITLLRLKGGLCHEMNLFIFEGFSQSKLVLSFRARNSLQGACRDFQKALMVLKLDWEANYAVENFK
jgi:hypothetical protein